VLAAVLVMLFGAGVCALGVFAMDLYFVGAVIWSIGAIGFLVWAGNHAGVLVRRLRR
jgi:hypothetical protein